MKTKVFLSAVALGILAIGLAQVTKEGAAPPLPCHAIHLPTQMSWQDAPPSLPPGAKVSVLEGDPAKPGPFTMRVKMPDGYKVMPHTHPNIEHVTVITGTFNFGMGDKFDQT